MAELRQIEIRALKGLSLKPDTTNRDIRSWRKLENFDLFVPGSIRKVKGHTQYADIGVLPLAVREYRKTDDLAFSLLAWGSDGKLHTLPGGPIYDSGLGAQTEIPFMCLLPGTLVPYIFVAWKKATARALNDAVVRYDTAGRLCVFVVTVAGISDATAEPTWPETLNATVADGTVTWKNVGEQDSVDFSLNYLVVIPPTKQPIKFDGTDITDLGVSAPTVQVGIGALKTTTSSARGILLTQGRNYGWTLYNPRTLHESSMSPIVGKVVFYAKDLTGNAAVLGCFLPPAQEGSYYSSIFLGIGQKALSPKIGDGFNHVRFYATRDGGSVLYLIRTLYNASGNVISNSDGSVPISELISSSDYLPVAVTQSKGTLKGVYDGFASTGANTTKDDVDTDPLTLQGNTPNSVTSQLPGLLPTDANAAAAFDGISGYLSSELGFNTAHSMSLVFLLQTSSVVGGAIGNVYLGGTSGDWGIEIRDDGKIIFSYIIATGYKRLTSTVVINDGMAHKVGITLAAGGAKIYIDGVLDVSSADAPTGTGSKAWFFARAGTPNATPSSGVTSQYYTGILDEIAFWDNTVLSGANMATLQAARPGPGTAYNAAVLLLAPTTYWRLGDISAPTLPATESSLVLPGPTFGENNPPPKSLWGAVYQGALFLQDALDRTKVWFNEAADFESFGQFSYLRFPTLVDDEITSLVGGIDKLIVGKSRSVQGLQGSNFQDFRPFPLDSQHGILGKLGAVSVGATVIALLQQGLAALGIGFQSSESAQIQLGFETDLFIGIDVYPITNKISRNSRRSAVACVDNTLDQILLALKSSDGQTYNDLVLVLKQGENGGFSTYIPPAPLISLQEVEFPDKSVGVVGLASDNRIYRLFDDASSETLTAVAETQELPLPGQEIPPEEVDKQKTFHELWVEGEDLSNYSLRFSVDGKAFSPVQTLRKLNNVRATGKRIVFQFTHSTDPAVEPLISYLKATYSLVGRTA